MLVSCRYAAGDISVGEASQNINSNDYKVGDFIGVEYASEKKSKKIFIAQVTNTDEDETLLEVINMRRCGRTNMFVFRPEDKCWVDVQTQILSLINQQWIRESIINFQIYLILYHEVPLMM